MIFSDLSLYIYEGQHCIQTLTQLMNVVCSDGSVSPRSTVHLHNQHQPIHPTAVDIKPAVTHTCESREPKGVVRMMLSPSRQICLELRALELVSKSRVPCSGFASAIGSSADSPSKRVNHGFEIPARPMRMLDGNVASPLEN
jgi:hypothetical protein